MSFETIKCWLIELFNDFIGGLMGWWIDAMIFILEFLPSSPFKFEPIEWGSFGMVVGYFIPIAKMLEHLAYILLCVAIWYAVQHIIRLLKIIR